jgi:hypothetical protein
VIAGRAIADGTKPDIVSFISNIAFIAIITYVSG